MLSDRGIELAGFLIPLCVVDEGSLACVVSREAWGDYMIGKIVRVHLADVDAGYQCAPLDVHPLAYLSSLEVELAAREDGLRRVLDGIGPATRRRTWPKEKRPRDFVIRPVRIACQNVIVGLAAFAQDSTFDGLSVAAWQTCEVPHVATHEGNRALAALTLCDAFQNGGTMEIRFDRDARLICRTASRSVYQGHPEKAVPASLRRFGRTVGVQLGAEDPEAITPGRGTRTLPRHHADAERSSATESMTRSRPGDHPERICFLLLSQVWREIEMDFMLATTARSRSILGGGAAWTDRASRQAESEICRGRSHGGHAIPAAQRGRCGRRRHGRGARGRGPLQGRHLVRSTAVRPP